MGCGSCGLWNASMFAAAARIAARCGLRETRLGSVEFGGADFERVECHAIELRGKRAQRGIAFAAYARDDLRDLRRERRVVLERGACK